MTGAVEETGSLGVALQDVFQVRSVKFREQIPAANKINVCLLVPSLLESFSTLPLKLMFPGCSLFGGKVN